MKMIKQHHGIITHPEGGRATDYLYRISLKCLIRVGDSVLVVKEAGRNYWDMPGGGMDHGEDFKAAIARELHEEVGMTCSFTHRIIHAEKPAYSESMNLWQVRLVFEVTPESMDFCTADDTDAVEFVDPQNLALSDNDVERRIANYFKLATGTITTP